MRIIFLFSFLTLKRSHDVKFEVYFYLKYFPLLSSRDDDDEGGGKLWLLWFRTKERSQKLATVFDCGEAINI